jgi:hypothetical protein
VTTPSPPRPVSVHVASAAPGVSLGRARAGDRYRTRYLTETVDNSNPVRPLLGDDPERARAWVQATGGDVVLCASESDAGQTPPNGSVLPSANTAPWPLRGQGAVWAAQKTAASTCVISVTADYAVPS